MDTKILYRIFNFNSMINHRCIRKNIFLCENNLSTYIIYSYVDEVDEYCIMQLYLCFSL